MSLRGDVSMSPEKIRERMTEAHIPFMNLDRVAEVRNTRQYFRDRRCETYGSLTELNRYLPSEGDAKRRGARVPCPTFRTSRSTVSGSGTA